MIVVLLAIVFAALAGAALLRVIAPDLHGYSATGASILIGIGYVVLVLFFLSVLHVTWSRSAIVIAVLAPLLLFLRRMPQKTRQAATPIDIVIVLLIAGHAIFATWAPMYEWDWFGIWGLKARTFFDFGGIDWHFIQTNISHPDYPLLTPLLVDYPSVVRRAWEDRFVGLMFTALSAGLILIVRGTLAEEFESEWLGGLGTLAITCPALNLWIGLAEGPVMAYGCAGLLLVRRGLTRASNTSIHLGAIFLGLSAWCKNEGLSLTLLAIFATLLVSWRRAWRLWPSLAISGIWLVARALLHLQTDFMQGDVLERVWFHLQRFGFFLKALFIYAPDLRLFWIAAFLTLIVFAPRAWRQERFLTIALLSQAFLMAAQALATRADLRAHIEFAWNRLPHQIAPAFGYLAVVLLIPLIKAAR